MPIDLVERFEQPSPHYGPVPLWWWSGERLELDRLRWQLDQLLDQGVHQAVVMNLAPTGPLYGALADDPPFMSEEWWAIFVAVSEYARDRGFQVWLYDQIGFSGANLQGHLVAEQSAFAGRSLSQLRVSAVDGAAEVSAPIGGEALGAWFAPSDGSAVIAVPVAEGVARHPRADGDLVLAVSVTRGFDYFSAEACAALIDRVFGEYERRVGHLFGTGIGGVFQDELPDVPNWSHDFAARFAEAAGYDILDVLPAVFGDTPSAETAVDAGRVRLDYHRVRALLSRRAFFDPLAAWLDAAGLPCGFDQQTPAREGEPIGAVAHYADYLETHAGYAIPGSDHWGDSKIHSSLAHAHGHGRVWIEAFHSSGWGGTLEETYDWLTPYYRRGATLYDPHAVYYSTRAGWFEWAPPSTCWRQPYWPDYHVFAGAVTRLSSLLTAGDHVASTVLYYPTEFVQSVLAVNGDGAAAKASEDLYFALNGLTAWFSERRGLLERAGVDYDILGGFSLSGARVDGDELVLAGERYRTVVLPGAEVLGSDIAGMLAAFASAGGRVVVVGEAPSRFVPALGADDASTTDAAAAFTAALASGAIMRVDTAEQVAAAVRPSVVQVTADAPVLHRRLGDLHVIAAIAHDEHSGTEQPMLPELASLWDGGDFDFRVYWNLLTERGYHLRSFADRTLSVRVDGLDAEGVTAQVWDPRTGQRRAAAVTAVPGGLEIAADFRVGSFAIIVVGPGLPEPTGQAGGERIESVPVDGDWRVQAESTLDNRWGDVDAPSRPGVVPVQVWEFEHAVDGGEASTVLATFGPFAEVTDAAGQWHPAEWSLSRGIHNDTIHEDSLGPNGYVPEEFVEWKGLVAGEQRRLRTTITVPSGGSPVLAVGANAARSVRFDGVELEVGAPAYLSFSAIPAGTGLLELEFTATDDGSLRTSFALTTDPARYARPEWVTTSDPSAPSTGVVASTTFDLASLPADARVQLSSESPTVLVVNGTEIARQSDFDPYAVRRFTRVHPYDLARVLRIGENTIEVRITDVGRPAAFRLDSVPADQDGLGIASSSAWAATREGRPIGLVERYAQYEDPRYGCIVPRPHPLQDATWLEGAGRDASVLTVVPDLAPGVRRSETLAFTVPIGATSIEVPTSVPFEVDDATVTGTRIVLPAPAGQDQRVVIRFRPEDGRRGGALLDGPVTVEVGEALAALRPWHELGLGALGGAVHYRRELRIDPVAGDERVVLELGAVRGTVEVRVDGALVETLFGGPWRAELTDAVRAGGTFSIEVTVRGTLAPYLAVASPTSAIAAGQTIHGLFGPVSLERWTG